MIKANYVKCSKIKVVPLIVELRRVALLNTSKRKENKVGGVALEFVTLVVVKSK